MLAYVKAEDAQIAVIEDAGRIVGAWGVFRVTHLEGVWIDPAYRLRPRAVLALKRAALQAAAQWAPWAWTGAATDAVRRLILKLGGQPVPMESYIVPVEDVCR
jgi:hypothetical protein